jgi:hypothetical protein
MILPAWRCMQGRYEVATAVTRCSCVFCAASTALMILQYHELLAHSALRIDRVVSTFQLVEHVVILEIVGLFSPMAAQQSLSIT